MVRHASFVRLRLVLLLTISSAVCTIPGSRSPSCRLRELRLLIFRIPPGTLHRPATVLLDDSLELLKRQLPALFEMRFRATHSISAHVTTKINTFQDEDGLDSAFHAQTMVFRVRRYLCPKNRMVE